MCPLAPVFLALQVPQTPRVQPEGMSCPDRIAAASTVSVSATRAGRDDGAGQGSGGGPALPSRAGAAAVADRVEG